MELVKDLEEACASGAKDDVEKAHERFVSSLHSMGALEKMVAFDDRHTSSPMFQVFNQYMRTVRKCCLSVLCAQETGPST